MDLVVPVPLGVPHQFARKCPYDVRNDYVQDSPPTSNEASASHDFIIYIYGAKDCKPTVLNNGERKKG